jgi:hypothetical protein
MSNKTKNQPTTTDKISQAAMQGGLVLMAAATTLGLMEVPHDPDKRVIIPGQPVFAVAHDTGAHPAGSQDIRRERDEVHPHYHGYSVAQRTPGRTGKI